MAGPASSTKAVVAALVANGFIAVIKFVAFGFSGSGAMLSEAIHSVADSGNQALLLIGLRRGTRERDDAFHYGYGGERFIFGMLSASGIFFVGAGVTIYHGIEGILHPHMPELSLITWAVLGVSLLIEGASTAFAFKQVLTDRPADMPLFKFLRERVDPAALAILLEDSAAIIGLLLAALGIVLAFVTGNAVFDALGSIFVGLLLGYVAIHLVRENRSLLLGKAAPGAAEEKFVATLKASPSVQDVFDVKTRQLTPEVFTFKAELVLNEAFVRAAVEKLLPSAGTTLTEDARTQLAGVLATHALQAISDEVDRLEALVREAIPEARHIDLEIDQTPDRAHARVREDARSATA